MEQDQFNFFMEMLKTQDYEKEELEDYLDLPDFNITTNNYEALIFTSLVHKDLETFKLFIEHPTFTWGDAMNIIYTTLIDKKETEFIDFLFELRNININCFDGYVLTKAAFENDIELIKKLLSRVDLDLNVGHGVAVAYSIYHKTKGDDKLYELLKADVRTKEIFAKLEAKV